MNPLPLVWLLSDARNDSVLEAALRALPPASGFVFRHYHLDPAARRTRFDALARLARELGHRVVLAGTEELAAQWLADGHYGPPAPRSEREGLYLATAHDAAELALAERAGADAVLLSPVFATASHPGAPVLGAAAFLALAQRAAVPVIALGGMGADRARALGWPRWAAIDGLSPAAGEGSGA